MKTIHNCLSAASILTLVIAISTSIPALAGSLSTPVMISGYALQPPTGYVRINAPTAPMGASVCAWVGPKRPDHTHPTLEMMIMTVPSGRSAQLTLPFLSDNFLNGKKRITTNWQASSPQYVTVHGLRFSRTCWTGNDTQTGVLMYGIQYIARNGNNVVLLASQDPKQDGANGIMLAQNAMLTIHKVH